MLACTGALLLLLQEKHRGHGRLTSSQNGHDGYAYLRLLRFPLYRTTVIQSGRRCFSSAVIRCLTSLRPEYLFQRSSRAGPEHVGHYGTSIHHYQSCGSFHSKGNDREIPTHLGSGSTLRYYLRMYLLHCHRKQETGNRAGVHRATTAMVMAWYINFRYRPTLDCGRLSQRPGRAPAALQQPLLD